MSNPYLKNKSFIRRNPRKVTAEVSTIAKKAGSNERYVGRNGEFNASSNKELLQVIAGLQAAIQKGDVLNPASETRRQRAKKIAADHRELITAAVRNGSQSKEWTALGAVMGDEIITSGDREGFATNLLLNKDLGAGEIPRFKVREKQTAGWQAISPYNVAPSVIRQGYVYPEEFYINVNIQVEEKEILQNPGDILEEKLTEGIEQTMVVEDRIFKAALDRTAGSSNDLFYFNTFTPTVMQQMKTQPSEWGMNTGTMLISFDIWNDIVADTDFVNFFDQVSKHEIVVNGSLASMLGLNIITDGFREPHLKVLNRGEVYILGAPQELGGITSRGELVTEPTRGYNMGQPWRGWFMTRLRSLVIGNSRAVVRAQRS